MLQRNTKLYGPMNVLDVQKSSSCWNSQGVTAADSASSDETWFLIDFQRPVRPTQLRVQFQAGFCAESCAVYAKSSSANDDDDDNDWECIDEDLEWQDVHEEQMRELSPNEIASTTALKLVLDEFTDFYGRVTIYSIQVWGQEGTPRTR